ncbi:DUF4241 domain-containing protein [Kitasatospora sp. NPDC089509]|uniref:DUF4241 domain-containing protein n=1 Tax=Kitasatospora sp. NPDC089509 TaxID=3364079 RepID=UPI003802FB9A
MPLPAPDVDRLFTLGSTYPSGDRLATVVALPTAELPLPSGTVSACDPLVSLEDSETPFDETAPPGRYPVTLSVVELTRPGAPDARPDRRVAAARLRFRTEPAARWALSADGDPDAVAALGDTDFFGYGVDTGTGCFFDAAAAEALSALLEEDEDLLQDALDGDPAGLGPVLLLDPDSGAGLVAFATGWGDGRYPTWAGYDADGRPVGLVTEFFVVPQPGRRSDEED